MKEAGNLEGILLTGLTKNGVDLMESYVDRTGDVQTASYCMLQVSVSLMATIYMKPQWKITLPDTLQCILAFCKDCNSDC